MMQQAALLKNTRRTQYARTKSIPAPVGGWNDRDSLAAMNEKDAVILVNWFPQTSRVIIRRGCMAWVTPFASSVESLMGYEPRSGTSRLFAASGTNFYDVTTAGAPSAPVVTGLTNARWQHTKVANSGGDFLLNVNGADKLRGWDGTAWWTDGDGAHDITGVNTANIIHITTFKRRVWMTEKNSTRAWYLPIDAIAGVASQFDLGPEFLHGGFLMAIANWTLDAGAGADDYSAFIGSNGDTIIYRGTDPNSATTWAKVGSFFMGAPIGRRCFCQYGGDVAVISEEGLVPLSKSLIANRDTTAVAFTDKIQNTVSASVTLYGNNYGWQPIVFSGQNMLILNVPIAAGAQQQYVMNTITGSWAQFKGWPAICLELFGDDLYYGSATKVSKAWQTAGDWGSTINAEALQAFNYFGLPDTQKEFTLARPLLAVTNGVGFFFGLNVDFDITAPAGVPTFTASTAGEWGTALWGVSQWGGLPRIQRGWQTVAGLGYCAAMHLLASTRTGQAEWLATDYAYKAGGIL